MFNPFAKSLTHKKESAFGAAALGGMLLLVSFPLLFWNEGRAVTTAQSLKEGEAAVIPVDAARVDPANEGELVHLSGKANTTETLTDDQFGVAVPALRLSRNVEMYQWVEIKEEVTKKREGQPSEKVIEYSYEKRWEGEPIDSREFQQAAQHQNPPGMPFVSKTIEAADVRVGGFRLPSSLVGRIDRSEPLMVDMNDVPDKLAQNLRADGGPPDNARGFYWSVNGVESGPTKEPAESEEEVTDEPPVSLPLGAPSEDVAPPATDELPETSRELAAEPQIGDLRITFAATYPTEVSILSQQVGESLQPFQTSGDRIHRLDLGILTAGEMFDKAHAENNFMTWAIRIVGMMMAMAGVSLVLRPITMLTDWIPMLGDLVGFGVALIGVALGGAASLITIAVAWLFYRPLLALLILAVAALLVVGAVFMIKSLRKRA